VHASACDLGLLAEASAFALLAEAKRAPLALAAIEPLLDALQRRLSEVSTCSTLLALVLIDALRISGHLERARLLTDEIIAFATTHGEQVYLPELLRMRGEQRESAEREAAAQDYRAAAELARALGAQSSELRATQSLARVSVATHAKTHDGL